MPRRPAPLPEQLATRTSFAYAEARRAGIGRSRLDASDLTTVFRGARLSADADPSVRNLALACAARMTDRQFFSHVTAAVLNGVPLPRTLERDARLHVSVMTGVPRPRVRGVIAHVLDPARTGTVLAGGIRMTDAPTTWCQLGGLLCLEDLVAAGEFILTRNAPLGRGRPAATMATLTAAVEAHRGSPGVPRLREAVPLLRYGALSRKETLLRLRIVRFGLPEPEINFRILAARHDGYVPMVDLAYPEYRVAIEYEGDHHRDSGQFRKDVRRYERIQDVGWLVVRVTARDVPDDAGSTASLDTLERIAARLRARGWSG